MKRIIFWLTLSLALTVSLQAQTFRWVDTFGSGNVDGATGVCADSSGNVYVTGYFEDTVDFDPGQGIFNLTSLGSSDVFIQKLDSIGNLIWANSFGGPGSNSGQAVALAPNGDIYTVGYFRDSIDVDPGPGTFILYSNGWDDIFIQKSDNDGNFLWAKSIGGSDDDLPYGLFVDDQGNIYVTGTFFGSVDFDPGSGNSFLTSNGFGDIFVLKLDSTGNFVWAENFGDSHTDVGNAIKVDNFGNIYVTGYFYDNVNFDPNGTYFLNSAGGSDVFVLKLDSTGHLVWANAFGGSSDDKAMDLDLDSLGNVYVAGNFKETIDADPGTGTYTLTSSGSRDIFIQKSDNNGNFVWAKSIGGSSSDSAFSISIDNQNNVYMTGYFNDTVDFDPGNGTANLTSSGDEDIFILKTESNGNFVWAQSFGGPFIDESNRIFVDAQQNIYTTGVYSLNVDFDPGPGVSYHYSAGNIDGFVQKMGPNSVGINQNTLVKKIKVYPNPVNDLLYIETGKIYRYCNINIIGVTGKSIRTYTFKSKNTYKVPVSHLPAGIYFVRLQSENRQAVFKFIKN